MRKKRTTKRKAATKKKTAKKGRNKLGQFVKGFYQPCTKGSRIRKAKKKR